MKAILIKYATLVLNAGEDFVERHPYWAVSILLVVGGVVTSCIVN